MFEEGSRKQLDDSQPTPPAFSHQHTQGVFCALITRALIVLEGITLKGDPSFDIFASAYPFAVQRAVGIFGVAQLSEVALKVAKLRAASAVAGQTPPTV